jgi:uncharacterized protein
MQTDQENKKVQYKTSQYNYFIEYKDKQLFFNGITGNGFCMTNKEYESLQPLLLDLVSFEEKYPSDFSRLVKLGYIIKDDFDEVTFIKYKNREVVFLNKSYRLAVNPTLECNFKCWYCYQKHPKGFMSEETMGKIKKHIEQKIVTKDITSLNLSWFGGEPLLYFYEIILPLSKFAKELCEENNIPFFSTMTTNAYLMDEKMISVFNTIGLKGFQITLDGGKNRHNKIRNHAGNPSYDIIIRNINLLCEKIKEIGVILRINFENATLELAELNEILLDIDKNHRDKIIINMQRVWQTNTIDQINIKTTELLSFMENAKKAGYKYVTHGGGLTIGTFHTCYVSRFYHLEINYDGKIYKCTAGGYDDKYVVGELLEDGTIKWDYNKISKIYASPTFDNPMCIKCKYLPICTGPCPRNIIEMPVDKLEDICPLKNSEQPISEKIINFYELSLHNKK